MSAGLTTASIFESFYELFYESSAFFAWAAVKIKEAAWRLQ